jgi:hypothetical protein
MSGMSYSVRLDEAAQAKIVEWQLPQEGMRAILQRMDDLSENPSRYLIRVPSSVHVLETDVVYHDPGPPPRQCLIVLSVRYGVDEETLHIVECDRLCDDKRDRPADGADPFPPDPS